MLRAAAKLFWTYNMPFFVAACAIVVAVPATLVFNAAGALAFGVLATAWLLLTRAFVAGVLGYLLKGLGPRWTAFVIPHFVVDLAAMFGAVALHPRLVWAILAGTIFSELLYTVVGRKKS
jgi:hypothetical protein